MRHTDAPAGHLATGEAAAALGVSKQTVRRYAAGGVLASITTDRGIFVSTTDVARLASQRANRSAS